MPNQLELKLVKRTWCDNAMPLFSMLPAGHEFTSDDLHTMIPTAPQHPNWYGVLMARAKSLQLVSPVGYEPSKRPEANGRVIRRWKKV